MTRTRRTDGLATDHISYNNHGRDRCQPLSMDSVIDMVDQGSIQMINQNPIQTAPAKSPLLCEAERGSAKNFKGILRIIC